MAICECASAGKTAIGEDLVQARIKLLKITKGMHDDGGTGDGAIERDENCVTWVTYKKSAKGYSHAQSGNIVHRSDEGVPSRPKSIKLVLRIFIV